MAALRAAFTATSATSSGTLSTRITWATGAADAVLAFETRLAGVSLSREEQRVSAPDDEPLCGGRARRPDAAHPPLSVPARAWRRQRDGQRAKPRVHDRAGRDPRGDPARHGQGRPALAPRARHRIIPGAGLRERGLRLLRTDPAGEQEQHPRWKRIVGAASSDLGEAVGKLYVDLHFPPAAKGRMDHLVANLLLAYRNSITALDWMTDSTRAEALTKLANLTPKIGYPDVWKDYSGLEIRPGDLIPNVLRAAEFLTDDELSKLGGPIRTWEWLMTPQTVNAYYHPLRNEIVFPAAILQPPFFDPDADDAVNYGAIGAVIGHEIGHGFDDQGSTCDGEGRLRDWWTPADRTEFERRAAVLVEQFSGYEVVDGVNVNGRLTLGENIADLGGIAVSLDAMHDAVPADAPLIDGLTPDQRFFAAYATMWRTGYTEAYARLLANVDTHSPSMYRVNGPLSNTPAFAAAFGIAEGSPMALRDIERARIW